MGQGGARLEEFPDLPLALTIDFLLGAHGLRRWRHVVQDLLNLRLAHPRLREAVVETMAMERVENALIKEVAAPIREANTGGPDRLVPAPTKPQQQEAPSTIKLGCTAYARPSTELDAFLRTPGGLEALSDKDLMAAHLLYGATTNDDKLRPDGRRGKKKNKKQPQGTGTGGGGGPAPESSRLPLSERHRGVADIRKRLPPRYFGLSAEGVRRLRAQEQDRVNKREAHEIYALGPSELAVFKIKKEKNPISRFYKAQHMIKTWELMAACFDKYGSEAGLEAAKEANRAAAAKRTATQEAKGTKKKAKKKRSSGGGGGYGRSAADYMYFSNKYGDMYDSDDGYFW